MKFFLDTANLDELKKGASWGIVDGVTTNPTLIAKEGRPIEEHVRMICDIVDGDISAEVVCTEAKSMIEEGRKLAKIHKNIVVKCPLPRDGIMATSTLAHERRRVNVTLRFRAASLGSPVHVIDAALAGAHIGTMPFKVLDMLFNHPLTDKGLDQFLKDWGKVFQETGAAR